VACLPDGTTKTIKFSRASNYKLTSIRGIKRELYKQLGHTVRLDGFTESFTPAPSTKGDGNPMISGHFPIVHEKRKLMAWCYRQETEEAQAAGWERKRRDCFTPKERKALKYWKDLSLLYYARKGTQNERPL